jgi:signal transduction histidine kinase
MMKYTGAVNAFDCQEAGSGASNCACRQVIRSGQTMMVNDVTQCTMLGEATKIKNGIEYFVSVPLKSKNRTLGVMNIAGHGDHCFSENDFRLLDSIGYHIGLAIENSFLYNAAKQKEELRGQLLNRVIMAQEEERKRIARELHDEYGQTLTGLVMSIEMLESLALPSQPQIKERLKDAKSLVGRAINDIRRLTLDLRPSSLDYLGLVDTVRLYSRSHLEALGIKVQFESSGLSQRLDPVVEVALFRIIQEAINNITKYAEAHSVKIKLESKDQKIVVLIEDDGKGFDAEYILNNRNERKSLGLLGIEERVTLLGGTFSIKSQIGQGTRLTIAIPLNQAVKVAAES